MFSGIKFDQTKLVITCPPQEITYVNIRYNDESWAFASELNRGFITKEYLGPLLLTSFNFDTSMDKQLYPLLSVGWNYLSIPKLQWYNRWS